jgi:hypothetical protein
VGQKRGSGQLQVGAPGSSYCCTGARVPAVSNSSWLLASGTWAPHRSPRSPGLQLPKNKRGLPARLTAHRPGVRCAVCSVLLGAWCLVLVSSPPPPHPSGLGLEVWTWTAGMATATGTTDNNGGFHFILHNTALTSSFRY